MKDKDIKKNRIFFVRQEPEEDVEKEFKKNRIKAIESEKKRYIPLLVASLSAVIVIIAIFIIIKYFYKKPQIFSPKEKTVLSDNEKKEIPLIDTESVHLRRGKDSFFKGYYNDAIAEFKEVVESGASDKDKAVALTYIGIIYDDRGEYNKAVEYYSRALKYDNTNPVVYRNLSLTYRHKKDLEKAQETIRKGLEIDPNNINNRLLYGNILFEQVKYEDAKLQYKKVIELDQNNSGALHNLALTLLKTGDESSAIKYLIKAGSSDKIGKVAYLSYSRLGVIFSERKDYVNALKYLKLATSINKKDPVDRYNLGIVYLKLNKKDKALYEFLKAEELGKDDVKLLENLGDAFFSIKEYDRSIAAYNKLLIKNKRNIKIISRIAEIYYENGDLAKSFEFYKKITILSPASENARVAYLNMGNILDDAERYDEAIDAYHKALIIDPKDDSAHYNLGIAYKHAGKYELAVESWRNASRINPDKPDPLLALSKYYYENNHFDFAMDEYQRLLRRWPDLQEAHFILATIYYKKNLLDYSKEEYKRVVEINNNNDFARKAYINLGIIALKSKKDKIKGIEKAMSYIQKALLLKPGDAEALFSMGLVYMEKDMLDKAIDTFHQSILSTRDSRLIADAYNHIGKCYYNQARYRKALQSFTMGLKEEPTFEEIRLNRRVAMQAYEESLQKN